VSGAGARSGKRAFDLLLGTTILLLASPLLAGLAAAVRLDSPGPAWFRQRRLGLGGRPFSIIKFRTMRHGSTRLGTGLETSRDDFRITRVGRILRNLRLDELPQLCNVLMGEMSLVGPRPLLPEFLPYYSPFDRRRLEVLPGMTGWQQVNGAARHSWRERVALDVWYVDHPSLALDLRILWMTVGVLLRADTVYAPDGSQKSGLPDAYVAAQEAGLHVRALPGHGVGESEGGRRASTASGRSPLSDIGADTVYAPDGSQKSGLPDAYMAAQRTEKEAE
jgi:lipopolysaccharide/colanic/teichoic acid biosynthesis glycosyltransferase